MQIPSLTLTRLASAGTILLMGATAGCSSSDDQRVCLSAEGAEVCIVGASDDLVLDASGLEPGSELLIETTKAGEESYLVSERGSPDGAIGFLGDFGGETFTISAVAASGELIDGAVTVGS